MTPDTFRHALILTGPTGSGKSRLALDLAEQLHAEIVCMDSMTLYRGMDIGTAKPTAQDRARVPHHLLDLLDPHESSSVAWWLEQAAQVTRDIESRGRTVIFVGGTGLYLKALLQGLFDGPPADPQLRAQLEDEARQQGNQALHDRLASVDPASANRLHPNDVRRVVRALEVHALTGRPISDWQTQWSVKGVGDWGSGIGGRQGQGKRRTDCGSSPIPNSQSLIPIHDRCLCLDLPREELYRRIDARVLAMMENGLVEEVRRLRSSDRPLGREAAQALGYKELFDHLEGRGSLDDCIREIQTRSRNFAKRQLTWFRHLQECQFVSERLTRELWSRRMNRSDSGGN